MYDCILRQDLDQPLLTEKIKMSANETICIVACKIKILLQYPPGDCTNCVDAAIKTTQTARQMPIPIKIVAV
jgi:hypothetical protein